MYNSSSSQTAAPLRRQQHPEGRVVFETNLGLAICRDGVWFKWWKDSGRAGMTGLRQPVTWWRVVANQTAITCSAKKSSVKFASLFPDEDTVVETNAGLAIFHNGTWFKWWSEMEQSSRVGIQQPITWWRAENGDVHQLAPAYSVKIGVRLFGAATWRRRDHIFVGDTLIGVINLGEHHRPGTTLCLANSTEKRGWSPQWCFEQHMLAIGSST